METEHVYMEYLQLKEYDIPPTKLKDLSGEQLHLYPQHWRQEGKQERKT